MLPNFPQDREQLCRPASLETSRKRGSDGQGGEDWLARMLGPSVRWAILSSWWIETVLPALLIQLQASSVVFLTTKASWASPPPSNRSISGRCDDTDTAIAAGGCHIIWTKTLLHILWPWFALLFSGAKNLRTDGKQVLHTTEKD